jgi:hypothetical protein
MTLFTFAAIVVSNSWTHTLSFRLAEELIAEGFKTFRTGAAFELGGLRTYIAELTSAGEEVDFSQWEEFWFNAIHSVRGRQCTKAEDKVYCMLGPSSASLLL